MVYDQGNHGVTIASPGMPWPAPPRVSYAVRMAIDPYADLTDAEVLARAAKALRKVHAAPVGSTVRALQWGVFESAKAELDLRMARHILAGLEAKGRLSQ